MIQMTLAHTASLLGLASSTIKSSLADPQFLGISIDTRTLQPGNLFVAIPGKRVDGHDFIEEAYQKGAALALVTRIIESPLPQIKVDDIYLALGKLCAAWRADFTLPMVAITGSNGKTTLKNMLAAIMLAACKENPTQVLATVGTLNNHLGLPLTLARLNKQHRYAAIEMGMNHFGEIEYLTQITKPTVAIITNAAFSHLEHIGDIEGVARAKAEIFLGLSSDGTAILNRDDAFFTYWRKCIGNRPYLTFGFHPAADVTAVIKDKPDSFAHLQEIHMHTPKGDSIISLPLLGLHNALNALAASATALAIGIDLETIKTGLSHIKPAPGRLQMHALSNGVNIIDDTYNANPFSLKAAVQTLASFTGKKILVLGDMAELGSEAKNFHMLAGTSIREAGIDYLFTYGDLSADAAKAFGEGAYHFNEQEKLVDALKPFLYNQTTILIKGSRSMRMEKVIAGLVQ